MDDEDLNIRLAATAPAVARRDGHLRSAINDVVTDSRPRRRGTGLIVAGSALSVVLLGGASAALASPSLLDWLGFTPDQTIQHVNADGDFCSAGMIVRPEGVPTDDPSYVAAGQILKTIDFETLSIPDDIRNDPMYSGAAAAEKAKTIAEYNAAHPDSTIVPAPSDPESHMLVAAAYRLITDGLTAQGLNLNHVSLDSGGTCDEVAR